MKLRALSIALIGFLVMFFSSGIKSVFQVNFVALAESFDVSRAALSIPGSLFMLVVGVGSLVAGFLCDRIGVKRTLMLSSALAGVALVSAAASDSFPVFIGMYGGVAALAFAGVQWVPLGVLVDQTFSEKTKGIALAAVTNGTAAGFALLAPLWVWLNVREDWNTVFLGLGLFLLVALTALIGFGLRVPRSTTIATSAPRTPTNWRGVLAGAEFWILALSFAGCGVNMAFIDVHLVPLLQDRNADPAAVASTLTALGIFEIIGGFAVGALAARSPFRLLLSSLYLVRGLSVFMLVAAGSQIAYVAFGAIFGLTYLGTVIITSLYCLRFYGKEIKGTVFGALWFGHQLGGVACVSLGALAYDLYGDYYPVLWATGAISLLSAALALTMPARISAGRQTQVAVGEAR